MKKLKHQIQERRKNYKINLGINQEEIEEYKIVASAQNAKIK